MYLFIKESKMKYKKVKNMTVTEMMDDAFLMLFWVTVLVPILSIVVYISNR